MCKQFQCLIIVGEVLYCKQHITATCFECLVLCLPCNIAHTLQYCVNIHACAAYSVYNTRYRYMYFLLKLAILHKSIKKSYMKRYMCRWLKIKWKCLNWTGAGQWDKLHHLASGIQCAMLLVCTGSSIFFLRDKLHCSNMCHGRCNTTH